jgi:exopolysaccharide production protein ExoQ
MGLAIVPPINYTNGTVIGIYGHKTALGYSAILSSFGLIAYLAYANKEMWGVLYALTVVPLVLATQSASALMAFSSILVLGLLLCLRRLRAVNARRWMLIIVLSLIVACIIVAAVSSFLFNDLLGLFGKNATLTGRTVLWAIAVETWQDSPIVGIGFNAFWRSAAYAHEVGFIHSYVDNRLDGFHSALLEAGVALGALGFCSLLAVLVIPLVRLGILVFVWLSLDAMIWLSLLLTFILITMFIQDVGFKQHSGSYLMMVFCYVYARSKYMARA